DAAAHRARPSRGADGGAHQRHAGRCAGVCRRPRLGRRCLPRWGGDRADIFVKTPFAPFFATGMWGKRREWRSMEPPNDSIFAQRSAFLLGGLLLAGFAVVATFAATDHKNRTVIETLTEPSAAGAAV